MLYHLSSLWGWSLGFHKLNSSFNITGPEKEFYSFYGRCFEGKQNKLEILSYPKLFLSSYDVGFQGIAIVIIFIFLSFGQSKFWFRYVYKVCPYKQASQEEGHSTTRLGLVSITYLYVLCISSFQGSFYACIIWGII